MARFTVPQVYGTLGLVGVTYSKRPKRPCFGLSFRCRSMLTASMPFAFPRQLHLSAVCKAASPKPVRSPSASNADAAILASFETRHPLNFGVRTASAFVQWKPLKFRKRCHSLLFWWLIPEIKHLRFVPSGGILPSWQARPQEYRHRGLNEKHDDQHYLKSKCRIFANDFF